MNTQAPPRFQARWEARHERLRALGFTSYSAYLNSPAWADVRRRYLDSNFPQACECCGDLEQVQLHHKTYDRVGEEDLDDLVPLCKRCHQLVHALERRGDIDLDLEGLLSTARAAVYAVEQRRKSQRSEVTAEERFAGLPRRLQGLLDEANAAKVHHGLLFNIERKIDALEKQVRG